MRSLNISQTSWILRINSGFFFKYFRLFCFFFLRFLWHSKQTPKDHLIAKPGFLRHCLLFSNIKHLTIYGRGLTVFLTQTSKYIIRSWRKITLRLPAGEGQFHFIVAYKYWGVHFVFPDLHFLSNAKKKFCPNQSSTFNPAQILEVHRCR